MTDLVFSMASYKGRVLNEPLLELFINPSFMIKEIFTKARHFSSRTDRGFDEVEADSGGAVFGGLLRGLYAPSVHTPRPSHGGVTLTQFDRKGITS
jgi:hypothetical protein